MKIALRLIGFALVMVFVLVYLATAFLIIVPIVEYLTSYWDLSPFMVGVVQVVLVILAALVGAIFSWRGYRLVGHWTKVLKEDGNEKTGTKNSGN